MSSQLATHHKTRSATDYACLLDQIRIAANDPAVSKNHCLRALGVGWETLAKALEDEGIAWTGPNGTASQTVRNMSLAEQYESRMPEILRLAADSAVAMDDAAAMLGIKRYILSRLKRWHGFDWRYENKPRKQRERVMSQKYREEQITASKNGAKARKELSHTEQVRHWLLAAMLGKGM